MMASVLMPRSSRRGGLAAVLVFTAATLSAPSPPAGAAQADCKEPPGTTAWGCLWTAPNYTGTMTLFEGTGRNPRTECRDGTPRSAVNNGPPSGKGRYVFLFYKHPGCEKGGKAFGILPPGQSDPDLPGVQSYAWTNSPG
jgi:Peptidase inhibitor family I36